MTVLTVDDRLSLHPISAEDAESIFALIDANRTRLREWLYFVDLTRTVDDTAAYIQSVLSRPEPELVTTMRVDGIITGLIGFRDTDRMHRKTEIGYWIAGDWEGQGIVTRSCKALVDHAFRELDINRITIRCGVGNQRSSAIPKRLCFMFEGIERESEWVNDRYVDHEVFSLLRREWNPHA